MDFYTGHNGVNMSKNTKNYLNDSSPFDGSIHRWYCYGPCTGRFASLHIPQSLLATLKGCYLRIVSWFRKLFYYQ